MISPWLVLYNLWIIHGTPIFWMAKSPRQPSTCPLGKWRQAAESCDLASGNWGWIVPHNNWISVDIPGLLSIYLSIYIYINIYIYIYVYIYICIYIYT